VRAPVVVVVASGQVEHRGGQVVGEGGPVSGRPEADPGVDGQGRQALAGRAGPAGEGADLAHQPTGQRDEVAADRWSSFASGSAADAVTAAGDTTYDAAVARSTRSVMPPCRRSSASSTRPCASSALRW
jgi:hypothetical protein